jgi:hypothetical protein
VGVGIVRVDAGPRMLVLNADGQEDNLTRALRDGRIDYDVAAVISHPLTQDALDPYRAVVLENVPARDLGRLKMERLAQFTEDMGGGLLMTGGERSFGTGGYFKSALDETIPVSMEMREEHRKNRLALAVALDRSGSMSMPVAGGKTKMDLANVGTAECVNMLSAGDSVAVIAVDSTPHVVQPMIDLTDKDPIIARIKKIERRNLCLRGARRGRQRTDESPADHQAHHSLFGCRRQRRAGRIYDSAEEIRRVGDYRQRHRTGN